MSGEKLKVDTKIDMVATGELQEEVKKELLQDDPSDAQAMASIASFVKKDEEEQDGDTQ